MLSGEFDGQSMVLSQEIFKQDWLITMEKASSREITTIVTPIAHDVSWLKLNVIILNERAYETAVLQSLYNVMTYPNMGDAVNVPGL